MPDKEVSSKILNSRARLIKACSYLEKVIDEKLEIGALSSDDKNINQLQHEIHSLKRDSVIFMKENEELVSRINKIRAVGSDIVRNVKIDLKQIKLIVKENADN